MAGNEKGKASMNSKGGMAFDYADAPFPIREDIPAAHRAYWETLAKPGSWWSGEERVAIAAACRQAISCGLCARRVEALSPNSVMGEHDGDLLLPASAVDAVHRIVTDQHRITRQYVENNVAQGLAKEAYVELVGVVVAVLSIDEFHRALGLELEPLPTPEAGEISRYRPAMLSDDVGFVPTVPPDGSVGNEADLWPQGRTANVVRALTLVPDAMRDWRALAGAQYLSFAAMRNMGQHETRAIDRMQMELIAARVSAVNQCFY